MPAPKGNQFWKMRSKHGRDRIIKCPKVLWESACEYFEWCTVNPLYEARLMKNSDGEPECYQVPKVRAFTLEGLQMWLNIDDQTYRNLRKVQDFLGVTQEIERAIYRQKFEHAAADMLNQVIIARDLGLRDHSDFTTNGKDIGSSLDLSDMPDELIDMIIAAKDAQKSKP